MNVKISILSCCLLGLFGCDYNHGEYRYTERHPVNQIFRDHNGYRVRWTDENRIDHEIKYVDWSYSHPAYKNFAIEKIPTEASQQFKCLKNIRQSSVFIIRDVENGGEGYANVLHYRNVAQCEEDARFGLYRTFVEIHLPPMQCISPGSEKYGFRPTITSQMGEVK